MKPSTAPRASVRLENPSTPEAGLAASTPYRRPVFLLKVLATLVVCGWILMYLDWALLGETIRRAQLWIVIVVVAMRFVGLTLSAYKWQQLLAIHGVAYRLDQLVRWYLVGTFLNHFMPTSIGGDTYRVYRTLGNARSRSTAVFAVLMERATGFLALFILGMVAAFVVYRRTGEPVAAAVLATCAAGLVFAVGAGWLGHRFASLSRFASRYRWTKWLNSIPELVADFRRYPRQSLGIAVLSFLFHANKLCGMWLLVYALGTPLDPLVVTLAVVGVETVGLLPITLGGLGVMDGSFIYLVGQFGLAPEPALAAMLLARVLNLPLSFAGAAFYALGDRSHPSGVSAVMSEPIDSRLASSRADH